MVLNVGFLCNLKKYLSHGGRPNDWTKMVLKESSIHFTLVGYEGSWRGELK